jgi:hypothetical protein
MGEWVVWGKWARGGNRWGLGGRMLETIATSLTFKKNFHTLPTTLLRSWNDYS